MIQKLLQKARENLWVSPKSRDQSYETFSPNFRIPPKYPIPTPEDNITVIIVDMQDYFLKNHFPNKRMQLIENENVILNYCAKLDIPVVALYFEGFGEINPDVMEAIRQVPRNEEFEKDEGSGFTNPKFCQVLEKWHTDITLTSGINTSYCFLKNVKAAMADDYRVATSGDLVSGTTYHQEEDRDTLKFLRNNVYFSESYSDLLPLLSLKNHR